MKIAIWWIRRDIRLTDNPALNSALKFGERIIPLFILDEHLLNSNRISQKRLNFLYQCLTGLDHQLLARQSCLFISRGKPLNVLKKLCDDLAFTHEIRIFAEKDHSPYANRRDSSIQIYLPVEYVGSTAYYPPGSILKNDLTPYIKFTPFSRAWKSQPFAMSELIPKPDYIPTYLGNNLERWRDQEVPAIAKKTPINEDAALKQLRNFTTGEDAPIYMYEKGRNSLEPCQTSRISPFLRFGVLSIRQVVQFAHQAIQSAPNGNSQMSARAWLDELIWRDFFIHILHYFPQTIQTNFQSRQIDWINNELHFNAWKEGRTGVPIVDAGMRQLRDEGWLPNRVRMIVASFLTKDLLIDWRWGEEWFMQNLIDGDPPANIGGWQWIAGTGTDAAPYFRVINPFRQSQIFDPQGLYIKKYLPELSFVPTPFIHQPFQMPLDLQKKVKCIIGKDYPTPLVDHSFARQRALDFFRKSHREF